jgi:hypothetical protein
MVEHLILRRRERSFGWQLAAGIAIASIAIAGAGVADGSTGATLAATIAGGALFVVAAIQSRHLRKGPKAVMATADYLGLLSSAGERSDIRWDDVCAAKHEITFEGMRWSLRTTGGTVGFADPGVDPDRWGLLWRWVASCVLERGGSVRVDPLSNTLFD